ncbi:hypothetical protein M9Y10_023601 [Tritrichomonas musculus]|uniref:Ankyrin n=1 Tax=Tritrichomonas musculus TaxID=1915356 RepID=A0ABR2KVL4_9EUKA
MAIEMNNKEIIEKLSKLQNIDVNIKNYVNIIKKKTEEEENLEEITEISPLQIAVKENNIDVVKYLLANQNTDINAKSLYLKEEDISHKYEDEKTALHCAVENENIEIIQLLMKHKAIKVDEKNKNEKTPIELTNNEDIKKMLSIELNQ